MEIFGIFKGFETICQERSICFEDVIAAINDDKVLDIIPHHNKKLYSNPMILVVEIKHYVYLVPYVEKKLAFLRLYSPAGNLLNTI